VIHRKYGDKSRLCDVIAQTLMPLRGISRTKKIQSWVEVASTGPPSAELHKTVGQLK
jgi:hypothetical protein